MLYVDIPLRSTSHVSMRMSQEAGLSSDLFRPGVFSDLDGSHIYRGKKSPVAGHIEATYQALWPGYFTSLSWCLIISYDSNCVSDDEDLWLEVKAACDFARAITQGRWVS